MIQELLDHGSPRLDIALRSVDSSDEIAALERAGVVETVDSYPTEDCRVVLHLRLTEKGARIAEFARWTAGKSQLDVPLGKLIYTGEQSLEGHPPQAIVDVKVRFEENNNVPYLLRFGPANIWNVTSFAGQHLTLAGAGKVIMLRIPVLWNPDFGWNPYPHELPAASVTCET